MIREKDKREYIYISMKMKTGFKKQRNKESHQSSKCIMT